VAVYTHDSDTPVSWDTRLKEFRGYASEPYFNYHFVSYEGTCARSRFFTNKEPVVQNLLTMKSWQTGKPTSTATFFTGFSPSAFFRGKNPVC